MVQKWKIINSNILENFTAIGPANINSCEFICPTVPPCEISGIKSRWIRVRIDSGDYGQLLSYKEVSFKSGTFDDFFIENSLDVANSSKLVTFLTNKKIYESIQLINSTLKRPFVNSISIQCRWATYDTATETFSPPLKDVQLCKTYNNFEYITIPIDQGTTTLQTFKPFEFLTENPSFYIGFDEFTPNSAVSLYFSKAALISDNDKVFVKKDNNNEQNDGEKINVFSWEYYKGEITDTPQDNNSGVWTKFNPQDDTENFCKNGIVQFVVPSDIMKTQVFEKENEHFWIRIEAEKTSTTNKTGTWFEAPEIKWNLCLNTVWAESASIVTDELLAEELGNGGQSFKLKRSPVLEDVKVEIMEPGAPTEKELSGDNADIRFVRLRTVPVM